MSEEKKPSNSKIQRVALKNLYLDPNNFRLIHERAQTNVDDATASDKDVAARTYRLLVGDRNQNVQDLVESFKSNGYLPVDQIQVRLLDQGGYVVVEGNRRIAALKFLKNEYESKNIDLGALDKSVFSAVPVVLYDDPDEVHHLLLMGLKHISGNRKWGQWNQAKLLEALRDKHGLPEDEICKRVGISKTELRRSLRALGLANQYQDSDYGDQFTESMFPTFREAARNTILKQWLMWDDNQNRATNDGNAESLFSWLSKEPTDDDTADDEDFRLADDYLEPAITRREDIVTLSKIMPDPKAFERFQSTRNLNEAYRASDLLFREKINDAINSVVSDVDTLGQLSINQEQVPQLESALGKLRGIVEQARSSTAKGVEQTTVFFDRIDNHFTTLKVQNYRGLDGLEINQLSRINLFAGMNNCGKTSLLEAIYLLCKQNDFNGVFDVIRRRGKVPEDHVSTKWLAQQLTGSVAIEGTFDNKNCSVGIRAFHEEDTAVNRTRYLKSVEIDSRFDSHKQEALTRIYEGRDRETQADSIKLLCNVVYSSPFFLNEPYHYSSFYHKSVQSKLLPSIFTFIRDKVVPTIKDIRLVDEFQRFLVNDDGFEESMDLTSYGEGLQRVFFTALLFSSAKDGIVLIDEFENAIHADLVGKFASYIYTLSKEFNVQVFLTSHSKECIDAFVTTAGKTQPSDFTLHALLKERNDPVTVRGFSGAEYSKLLKAADVDLRRAR